MESTDGTLAQTQPRENIVKSAAAKTVSFPKLWEGIIKTTTDELKEHHRHNQLVELLSKWDVKDVVDVEKGTGAVMHEKRNGRLTAFSNYRGRTPMMRLFDFDLGVCLECGILNCSKGYHIHTIFMVDYRGEKPVTTKLFEFDRETDMLHAFDANIMSELNKVLEK